MDLMLIKTLGSTQRRSTSQQKMTVKGVGWGGGALCIMIYGNKLI